MVKVRDIRSCLPQNKNRNSSVFDRYIIRPISIVCTVPFIKLGISANAVSYVSLIVAVIGVIAVVNSYVLGGLLIIFWDVLDCIDGNIARYVKNKSDYGDFIDSMSSLFIVITILPAMAWNVIYSTDNINSALTILGSAVAVGVIVSFSRIIYQKYRVVSLEMGINIGVTSSKAVMQEGLNKKSLTYIANRIEKNFGITGIFLPCMILSELLGFKITLLIIFEVYSLATALATILIIFIKVNRHEKKIALLKR